MWVAGDRALAGGIVAVVIAFGALCSAAAASAPRLRWSAPKPVDKTSFALGNDPYFQSVACPDLSLCVAVGAGGLVATSGGSAGWKVDVAAPNGQLQLVSCPSVGMCIALDNHNRVLVSRDPAGGSAWSPAGAIAGLSVSPSSLSCPTANVCVAAGSFFGGGSNGMYSTGDPAGSSAWTTTQLSAGGNSLSIAAVSCTPTAFCVALASDGRVAPVHPLADRPHILTGW